MEQPNLIIKSGFLFMELEEFYKIVDKEARKHNIPGMEWQDIAQEVKLRLWLKYGLYDSSKSSFRTWANRVMKVAIYELLRKSINAKNRPLNKSTSMEMLAESGLDIDEDKKIYKLDNELY